MVSGCSPGSPTQLYKSPSISQPQSEALYGEKEVTMPPVLQQERPYVTKSDLPDIEPEIKQKAIYSRKGKIAMLIPLSGESKSLGKSLLDSAQLAIFDINNPNIQLVPIDTKSTTEGAVEAAHQAVAENVELILGPVFSESAKAVAPIAKDSGINVISFSNDPSLTDEGIFLLGFMPGQQVKRVVSYASRNGIEEFSGIVPDSKFGEVAADEMRSALFAKFGRIKHIERYSSIDESLSLIIDKFVQPIEEKEEGAEEGEEEEKPFRFEFEAMKNQDKTVGILVPEGGRTASIISARIFRHGMDSGKIRLLGTGQWDDQELFKEKKLAGSWFATSSPKYWEIFEKHFKDTYGYVPIRIASLAYDGIALAAYLASQNDFSKSAITNRRGFSGINGVFRIDRDGGSERALAVLEITEKGGFKIVDPAPADFNSFSY